MVNKMEALQKWIFKGIWQGYHEQIELEMKQLEQKLEQS
jgi:hypothetical protein